MKKRKETNKVIIHCSNSQHGNVDVIRRWHLDRGFSDIGYHFVITNGNLEYPLEYEYSAKHDGIIQRGRNIDLQGAHCKGENKDSIGICLIGEHHFTQKQLYVSLPMLLGSIDYYLGRSLDIFGHNDFTKHKTCPNFKYTAHVFDRSCIYTLLEFDFMHTSTDKAIQLSKEII